MATADYTTVVQQLYIAYFGRPADPEALVEYSKTLAAINAPTTLAGLVAAYNTSPSIRALIDSDNFGSSKESQVLYPHGDNGLFVDAIYQNLLNRAPDGAGWAYWKGEIDSGRLSKTHAALAIAAGAMTNGSLDGLLISKKTSVAIEFTNRLDTDAEKAAFVGKEAAEIAREMLLKVSIGTKSSDLIKLVDVAVETLVTGEVPETKPVNPEKPVDPEGKVITGGSGKDSITGGSGKDSITGGSDKDSITGGAGNDTINGGGGADTIEAGEGDDTIVLDGGLGIPTTINGGSGTDTINLKLANSRFTDWGMVSATGVEKINIESSSKNGSANVLSTNFTTDNGQASYEMNITGNARLGLDSDFYTNIVTIDASGNTGGLNVTGGSNHQKIIGSSGNDYIDGGEGNDTIIGGAGVDDLFGGDGDDTIVFGGNLNKAATIDGGDGIDAIVINRADIAVLNSMPAKAITGFETVRVNGALTSKLVGSGGNFVGALDMAKFDGVKHIILTQDNDNNGFIYNLLDNSTIEFTGSGWDDNDFSSVSLASDTSNDKLNLKLTNTNEEDWGSIITTQVERINIESNSTNDKTNILDVNFTTDNGIWAGAWAVPEMKITGNARLDLDNLATNVVVIDASDNSGGLDVKGGITNQTITGSKVNDNINGGGGNDTIIGGAGADTLVGGTGVDSMTGGDGADVFSFTDVTNSDNWSIVVTDTITDFVKGTDELDFITEGAYNNFFKNTGVQYGALGELAVYAEQALRQHAHDYYFGLVKNGTSADGYLFYDANGTGYTSIIKLTGVTDLDFGDIV